MNDIGVCVLIEPIHPAGVAELEKAGAHVRLARGATFLEISREVGDARFIVTRGKGIDAGCIDAAPRLRAICHHGVGLESVDVARATRNRVLVTNTPHANTISVAEHAIHLMLATARHVFAADSAARAGDFTLKFRLPGTELANKTLGLVGFGHIGQAVARIARNGFGMKIIVHTRTKLALDEGVEWTASLAELLSRSDIVSLHLPQTAETTNLMGALQFSEMKPGATFINVSRGGLVDEDALAHALRTGRLSGAGIDVFTDETNGSVSPLATLKNAILSPHIAGSTLEAAQRVSLEVAGQIKAIARGVRPNWVVNTELVV